MASGSPPTPMRSDARRNRLALVRTAAEAFRDEGLDVAVDEIARRAQVGVATLYRHFPTKQDLILAVTETVIDKMQAEADAALAEPEAEVVASFVAAAMARQRANRGLLEALAEHTLPPAARDPLTARLLAMLGPIVTAGHATGTLHPTLDARDVLMTIRMLGVTGVGHDPRDPERYLAIVLGGLAHPLHA